MAEMTLCGDVADKYRLSLGGVSSSGKEIYPRPCTHHAELVRQISGLCNNANQLAHRANSTGVAGQQSVDEMTCIAKEVWLTIKENY